MAWWTLVIGSLQSQAVTEVPTWAGHKQSKMSLEKQLFNLKFAAKSLERNAKRCAKDEAAEKLKLKKAITQQNMDGAKIHAEAAIRKKNESLNYLRLASRIDGVASQVQTAVSMRTVTKSMGSVVGSLDAALASNQLEKVSMIMDKFEQQVENLNVQSASMENAMSASTAMSTPADQVSLLMQQVADEHGLELSGQMMETAAPGRRVQVEEREVSAPKDDLSERLARLRNP